MHQITKKFTQKDMWIRNFQTMDYTDGKKKYTIEEHPVMYNTLCKYIVQ